MKKRVLNPERLRKVPPQFSWIDHRLVQENYFTQCDHSAWALYLFLVSVGDVQGLSYYSDAAIARHLKLDPLQVAAARRQLEQADLLAYRKHLYQVLALPELPAQPPTPAGPRTAQTQSVGDILRRALARGAP